jgi:hypothetical protein
MIEKTKAERDAKSLDMARVVSLEDEEAPACYKLIDFA